MFALAAGGLCAQSVLVAAAAAEQGPEVTAVK